jgi:hypothetical protein
MRENCLTLVLIGIIAWLVIIAIGELVYWLVLHA